MYPIRGSNELNVRLNTGLLSALFLGACATGTVRTPAPVVDRTHPTSVAATPIAKPVPVQTGSTAANSAKPLPAVSNPNSDPRSKTYTVKPGDTLYSIALENGLDYKEIAAWNQLADVNLIKVDQILRLTEQADDGVPDGAGVVVKPMRPDGVAGKTETTAVSTISYPKALKLSYGTDAATVARQAEGPLPTAAIPSSSPPRPSETKPLEKPEAKPEPKAADSKQAGSATGEEDIAWAWPTVGKVLTPFSESSKGLDIGGKLGQPVLAAGPGKIVYAGAGLRGYGKLVIIKHNKTYLSAYAHNSQLLVKEGDSVKKGDKIAEMGNTDAEQIKLHFEIRRFGKPVDPSRYLITG